MQILLECHEGGSSKFWRLRVEGAAHQVHFGRIGTQGRTQTKTFASPEEAQAAAAKLIAQKKNGGYREVGGAALAPRGGLFVKQTGNVTAERIIASLREDGTLSRSNPRELSGFGKERGPDHGVVGVAVHPEQNGYLAVADSADGAQGIGPGPWSRASSLASELTTEVIWFRIYSAKLALAARFRRGHDGIEVIPGDEAEVRSWLAAQSVPLDACQPPAHAQPEAVCVAIKYEASTYRSGPDEQAADVLIDIRNALIAGDPGTVRARCHAIGELAPLALGAVRTTRQGSAGDCLLELARAAVAAPLTPRAMPKQPTLDEEALWAAIAMATERGDAAQALEFLDRLDAIETDAKRRSAFAQTSGVASLAATFAKEGRFPAAYACYSRLVRRSAEPAVWHVIGALGTLCRSTEASILLEGEVADTVARCEKRASALGSDAKDAVFYRLGCVYARAGQPRRALAVLAWCRTPLAQHPEPDKDPDLTSLATDAEFRAWIDRSRMPGELYKDVPVDDLELSVRSSEALAERKVKTLDELLRHDPASFPSKVVAEICALLADEYRISWGEAASDSEGAADYAPPKERAVPRLNIALTESQDERDGHRFVSRVGGLPNAPSKDFPWPETDSRPMALVFQLVGKAGGGAVDLGDVTLLQVFADLDGDYYEENEVILHRVPCEAVMSAPVGLAQQPVKLMSFAPGADDRILVDVADPDDEDALRGVGADAAAYEEARTHAWCDKVGGIPVGANLDPDVCDSQGEPMTCVVELVTYDDWFLWALFANRSFSETNLQVVRG
jgi:predicted DNA-binding WGR domain protein